MSLYLLVFRLDRSLEQRAHEENAAARTFVLVLEREVSRAGLKTEPAVHALIDSRQCRSERAIRERACWNRVGWWRDFLFDGRKQSAAQIAGPMMPGLRM